MPCWVLDCFKRVNPSGSVFELDVPLIQWPVAEIHFPYYLVTVDGSSTPVAGDDARDAAWFTVNELPALDTSPGLIDALSDWGVIRG